MPADLSRRNFFSNLGRLAVLVPAGWVVVGAACGSSPAGECGEANSVMPTGAGVIVVSTCSGASGGHTHDFTLTNNDLATPPAAGVDGLTSPYDDDQHTHTVALTQAELQAIQNGATVTKATGTTASHSHTFNFRKA